MNSHVPPLLFLKLLLFKDMKAGILLLRGGLGNQLYQLSALAYFSAKFKFIPIIYDFDTRSFQSLHTSPYESLRIGSWFHNSFPPIVLRGVWELLLRVVLSINRRYSFFRLVSENNLETINFKVPKFLLIRDSFQNCKYPLKLPQTFHKEFFMLNSEDCLENKKNRAAVHIRLTDFLPQNPFDYNYYAESISKISKFRIEQIDCFSDDVSNAKSLISPILNFPTVWPEDQTSYSSVKFLEEFSLYPIIIASKSSLCWWASFLAWKRNPNLYLVHPWDEVEDFILANTF